MNTGQRLVGRFPESRTPEQMQRTHRRFWNNESIQEFWSGRSFSRADDGQMLSYDLARILVDQFSRDWESFKAFVLAASGKDGGDAAARTHLGITLGIAASLVTHASAAENWEPNPLTWEGFAEVATETPNSRLVCDNVRAALRFAPVAPHPGRWASRNPHCSSQPS